MQITVRDLKRLVREAAAAPKRSSTARASDSIDQLKTALPDLCSAISELESMGHWEAADWADGEFEGDSNSFDELCDSAMIAFSRGDIAKVARIALRFATPAEAVLDIASNMDDDDADVVWLKNCGRKGMKAAQAAAKLAPSSATPVSAGIARRTAAESNALDDAANGLRNADFALEPTSFTAELRDDPRLQELVSLVERALKLVRDLRRTQ